MKSQNDPGPQPELPDASGAHVYPTLEQSTPPRSGRGPKLALVAAAIAAVAVLAVVVGSVASSGRDAAPATGTLTATASDDGGAGAAAGGRVLVPAAVSTTCLNNSDPIAPFSGDGSRAWVCQRAHGLDQNVLTITFDKLVTITSIALVPGFDHVAAGGRDEWTRNRLITDVSWRMGGKVFPQRIEPARTPATTEFPSVTTQSLSLTINASTRPDGSSESADETTAVSKIVIIGHPGGQGAQSSGK